MFDPGTNMSTPESSPHHDLAGPTPKKKRRMFEACMSRDWDTVTSEFRKDPAVRDAKITSSEDTIVHFAVIEDRRSEVKALIGVLETEGEKRRILLLKNKNGSTPLHLAAVKGDGEMCKLILASVPSSPKDLIGAQNANGETPLFVAALLGKMEPFFILYNKLNEAAAGDPRNQIDSYIRRYTDGNTILHVAILGEHFELAFQIIKMYQEVEKNEENVLANMHNEKGQTALHILAKSPHTFKSGYFFGTIDSMIYSLSWADRLEKIDRQSVGHRQKPSGAQGKTLFPENYSTCTNLIKLSSKPLEDLRRDNDVFRKFSKFFQKAFKPISVGGQRKGRNEGDVEKAAHHENGDGDEGKDHKGTRRTSTTHMHVALKYLPPNYAPLFHLFRLVMMISLVFLGLGFWRTKTIKERKQRHTWAVQIMEELVKGASSWEYNADGKRPSDLDSSSFGNPDDVQTRHDIEPQWSRRLKQIKDRQQRHTLAVQILMEELVKGASSWEYNADGKRAPDLDSSAFENPDDVRTRHEPQFSGTNIASDTNPDEEYGKTEGDKEKIADNMDDTDKSETPILVAAKSGVVEMVELILDTFPVAIRDVNKEGKNVVLLAVENRQPLVYQLLMRYKFRNDNVFQRVDNEGNSALHLAAVLGEPRPWIIPGAALQMQWEIKWFKFVKGSVPPYFFIRVNDKGRTAMEIFNETHRTLVGEGGKWLNKTSQSCSVVAALIATVALAAAVTVPGGVKENKGVPNFEGEPVFDVFAISSLVAVGLSVTSLITFLSILTSRHVADDFEWSLPIKLMVGLTSLFFSITAILVSFCSGHYFILRNHLNSLVVAMYTVACFPVALFAFAQFPLYSDLGMAIVTRVPYRTYMETAY